jgi:hypothetical protein
LVLLFAPSIVQNVWIKRQKPVHDRFSILAASSATFAILVSAGAAAFCPF